MADAKRIGVLYYLPEESVYAKISSYVKKLQDDGKQVKALAYVDDKKLIGKFLPKLSFDFLYPAALKWNYKPVSSAASDFVETEFDILIDLSTKDILPLIYIAATSRAKFKAGMQRDGVAPYLDLMISLDEENRLDELITQIDHYLKLITNKNESKSI